MSTENGAMSQLIERLKVTMGKSKMSKSGNEDWRGTLDFQKNDVVTEPVVRLVFRNTQMIYAFKPGLGLSVGAEGAVVNWRFKASYAPWINLWLTQDLSTTAAGHPEYNTPKTISTFISPSYHSWGTALILGFKPEGALVDFDTTWEGTLYDYSALSIGGGTFSKKAWIIDGFFNLNLALTAVKIQSWIPRLGVGYDWSCTWDQAPGGSFSL